MNANLEKADRARVAPASGRPPVVSVVVPTYRRPSLLAACLAALRGQTRQPDEVIVVLRAGDVASAQAAGELVWDAVRTVQTTGPGVLAAMRAGVSMSSGDVIAFTDDDAEPRSDWLGRLLESLQEPGVGAAGGRDVIPGQTEPRRRAVGRVTRYGRLVGNHHLGAGPARDVDLLKGVNMAFRAECLALPRAGVLRGDGAEVHFEVLCTWWAKRQGWRVVYDPSIEVDHLGAERVGLDRRVRPAPAAVCDAAHNFVVATTALDRRLLPRQALYALAVGSRDLPGLGRAAVALVRGEPDVVRRLRPSLAGHLQGIARVLRGFDDALASCEELRTAGVAPARAA